MHVLILPSWYPRFEGDAEGSFFREQAVALANSGLKVGIVFPDLRGPGRFMRARTKFGIQSRCDEGLLEIRSHGFNWFPRSEAPFFWLWIRHAKRALKRYVKEYGKPDIVHVHSLLPAGLAAAWFHDVYQVPYVVTEHSTRFLAGLPTTFLVKTSEKIVSASRKNIAVSEVLGKSLSSLFGAEWDYVPNIVANRFLRHPLAIPDNDSNKVISIAILRQHKRMDLVIRAIAILMARNVDVSLSIIGDGPEKSRLKALVLKLKLSNNVEFLGQISRAELPAIMSRATVLVSASEIETFGVTLVEGLALGLPIVATPSGGPQSIVTPSVGRLVSDWDSTNLADAIEDIIVRKEQFARDKLREHCDLLYSEQAVSRALTSIYSDALLERA
jgi:glycosyltransferase involved in cell wall biosynthesis